MTTSVRVSINGRDVGNATPEQTTAAAVQLLLLMTEDQILAAIRQTADISALDLEALGSALSNG